MISNTTKLERLAQAVFRYVSIKKALFSFFYNSCKVLSLSWFNRLKSSKKEFEFCTSGFTEKKITNHW